jgi:hypothetical protein
MRIPEHTAAEELGVLADLRVGVERSAGVIEIDVFQRVEPAVLGRAEIVEKCRTSVRGIVLAEPG